MELRKCLCNRSGTLLDAHVGVFEIAHKYGLPMLMNAVKVSLEESFEHDGYYPEQEELAAALEVLADLSEAALLVRVFRRIIADAFVLAFLFQEKCPSGECQNAQENGASSESTEIVAGASRPDSSPKKDKSVAHRGQAQILETLHHQPKVAWEILQAFSRKVEDDEVLWRKAEKLNEQYEWD